MNEQENIKLIQTLYQSFQKGDIQAILSNIAPDAEWVNSESLDISYAGKRRGALEIGQFFQSLKESVNIKEFDASEYIAHKDRVIVLGHWQGEVKSDGHFFDSDWVMVFTLMDGKIKYFRSYEDTAMMAKALSGKLVQKVKAA